MDAKRYLLVKPLACEEAWTLFSELVGEDTLNSSPGIQQLAHSTLERCQGLPSAIIMAGRTLAGCKIVREWEQLTQELEDLIKEEISGMEDQLFHVLKLSYNSLLYESPNYVSYIALYFPRNM